MKVESHSRELSQKFYYQSDRIIELPRGNMSLEQVALQVGGGAIIGYITGWGLKKLFKIIIKIVAIVLADVL